MKKFIFFFLCFFLFFGKNVTAADKTSESDTLTLMQKIEHWYENNMNYGTITLLMAAESSILPVPSELVIPPAAYVASKPENSLNIFLVILFGTLGAVIGATLNYFLLGMWLGRAALYRFAESRAGHLLLLSGEKLQRAENYFNAHGKTSTFIGRFIPVVRHLISIPAGFAKMNYPVFLLFTAIGAGLWNVCLAFFGYLAHGQAALINRYSHELSIAVAVVAVIGIIYLIVKNLRNKNK